MTPTIFCDYAGTIDLHSQSPLLDMLQGFSREGAHIYLATDGDRKDGQFYLDELVDRGYFCFGEVISKESFGLKGDAGYWPGVLQHFKLNANTVIMLDDNPHVLDNASKNNIRAVNSKLQLPMDSFAAQVPAVAEKLNVAYQEVCAL
jgi:FMN phosphatase YigB (HAD superfamily)